MADTDHCGNKSKPGGATGNSAKLGHGSAK